MKETEQCRIWWAILCLHCREKLQKQISQLKQENTIMEEANARYSKLQLIEAEVSDYWVLLALGVLSPSTILSTRISMYSGRTNQNETVWISILIHCRMEKEIMEYNIKLSEMQKAIDQSQEEVKQRELQVETLQKQLNTMRFAYIK